MKGTKRFGVSDSNPDTNDSAFRSKRIMAGSPFDVRRAENSQPQLIPTPPLDVQRAESSRLHVRALNTQFASWVQTQLQSHPDELWEDGVRDYLSHASNIMEKFSDVVNWLKVNAVKGKSLSAAGSLTTEKKLMPEIKSNETKSFPEKPLFAPVGTTKSNETKSFPEKPLFAPVGTTKSNETKSFPEKPLFAPVGTTKSNEIKSFQEKPLFAPVGTTKSNEIKSFQENPLFAPVGMTASFATSWSSRALSNSQTPILFGSQSTDPASHDASDDVDGEADLEQPSSPSVKKTEEMGIIVVHEVKCKLYMKSSDPADKDRWKDKGMGHLSIKCKEGASKGTKESKPTVIVRNDVGKLLLNALLYPGIKTNLQKNSLVAIFHTSGDEGGNNESVVARTFLIRMKTLEDRNKLATAIQEYAPAV